MTKEVFSFGKVFLPLNYPKHKKNSLTYDVVSTVGTGVMLEEPGVDTFLVKPVSTGNNPQLLEGKTQDLVVSYGHWHNKWDNKFSSIQNKLLLPFVLSFKCTTLFFFLICTKSQTQITKYHMI